MCTPNPHGQSRVSVPNLMVDRNSQALPRSRSTGPGLDVGGTEGPARTSASSTCPGMEDTWTRVASCHGTETAPDQASVLAMTSAVWGRPGLERAPRVTCTQLSLASETPGLTGGGYALPGCR